MFLCFAKDFFIRRQFGNSFADGFRNLFLNTWWVVGIYINVHPVVIRFSAWRLVPFIKSSSVSKKIITFRLTLVVIGNPLF